MLNKMLLRFSLLILAIAVLANGDSRADNEIPFTGIMPLLLFGERPHPNGMIKCLEDGGQLPLEVMVKGTLSSDMIFAATSGPTPMNLSLVFQETGGPSGLPEIIMGVAAWVWPAPSRIVARKTKNRDG